MKRKSVKTITASIAMIMCLSACTSTGNVVNSDGATGVSTPAIGDATNSGTVSDDTAATGYQVTVVNHPISSSQDGKVLCTGSYPEIVL